MTVPHQPSGISQGLPFLIPADWTPEQAQAVVDLLDDLREHLWAHYQIALYELRGGIGKSDSGLSGFLL